MEEKILRLLSQSDYSPADAPQLLKQLHLPSESQPALKAALRALEKSGQVVRTKGNRYIEAREADLVPGVIQITRGGRGFVQPDEPGIGELAIAEQATGTAMHGDRVLVRREVRTQGLRRPGVEDNAGTVVRILARARTRFVGTLQRSKQFLHVIPDDPRLPRAILVPPPRDVGRPPNPGDKVVVELVQWESRQAPPEGEIIEVLGPPDQEGVDMLSVLRHYDLPLHFPKAVLHEANVIAKSRPDNQPAPEECADRVDCRKHRVVTIDPDDAKDFDDAICIQRHGADEWKVWVHIADVSHYVRPGSALDTEARKRGNSTYLVDRVIPMLPEALSNELCSLKPDVDRLTKCVEFVLSKEGEVLNAKFYAAVIRSCRRFTYREALAVIQGKPADEIEAMLLDAHALAQRVRRLRFKNGSLDLDFPENKIRLDEHGRVLRIERIENDVSHQLIEEYMLLANEAVAARLMKLNRPAVYRVHEAPKEKRLNDFREDVLGHRVPCGNLNHRPEVQRLLARLADLPIGPALKIGFLKSLMRARYAVEPLGHYGLAKTRYTHFTSPIRRYADLVIHRALFEREHQQTGAVKQIADHITTTERNSADAERDSKEVKLYAHLQAQIDARKLQTYGGLVTDLRNFGFFVDVAELGLSGLVPLSAIPDDFFVFDPARSQLVGRRTRRVIQLGCQVQVQVRLVDRFKKQVDFQLVSERAIPGRPEARTGEHGRRTKPAAPARSEERNRRTKPAPAARAEERDRRKKPAVQSEERAPRKKPEAPAAEEAPRQGFWARLTRRAPKPAAPAPPETDGGRGGRSAKPAKRKR